MTPNQLEVCERLGWIVSESNGEIELETTTPAGEDFIFTVTDLDDIPKAVRQYADSFDVDEHIEMWILARRSGVSGVPSVAELVDDALAIRDMLRDLAEEL